MNCSKKLCLDCFVSKYVYNREVVVPFAKIGSVFDKKYGQVPYWVYACKACSEGDITIKEEDEENKGVFSNDNSMQPLVPGQELIAIKCDKGCDAVAVDRCEKKSCKLCDKCKVDREEMHHVECKDFIQIGSKPMKEREYAHHYTHHCYC